MWGTYFHMGSYKFNVIEMSAYIHGCLFSMGAHYSDFRLFFYNVQTLSSIILITSHLQTCPQKNKSLPNVESRDLGNALHYARFIIFILILLDGQHC